VLHIKLSFLIKKSDYYLIIDRREKVNSRILKIGGATLFISEAVKEKRVIKKNGQRHS